MTDIPVSILNFFICVTQTYNSIWEEKNMNIIRFEKFNMLPCVWFDKSWSCEEFFYFFSYSDLNWRRHRYLFYRHCSSPGHSSPPASSLPVVSADMTLRLSGGDGDFLFGFQSHSSRFFNGGSRRNCGWNSSFEIIFDGLRRWGKQKRYK